MVADKPCRTLPCFAASEGLLGLIQLTSVVKIKRLPVGKDFESLCSDTARPCIYCFRIIGFPLLQVIHDCRGDSVNLHNQFGIMLCNVFDTQVSALMTMPILRGARNGFQVIFHRFRVLK